MKTTQSHLWILVDSNHVLWIFSPAHIPYLLRIHNHWVTWRNRTVSFAVTVRYANQLHQRHHVNNFVVSRTGLEPVFPPWKGDELTCYSSGTFMYRESESNWHGHFCPSDFKSDVSTNFTIPAHHRNKLNKTNCGGCRIRTYISFPNGCLVDSSCTNWGNPP